MKWEKISKYSWTSGSYAISANGMGEGKYRFSLYQGDQLLAIRDTAKELRQMTEERLKPHEKEAA
jgi:hypothetical protein